MADVLTRFLEAIRKSGDYKGFIADIIALDLCRKGALEQEDVVEIGRADFCVKTEKLIEILKKKIANNPKIVFSFKEALTGRITTRHLAELLEIREYEHATDEDTHIANPQTSKLVRQEETSASASKKGMIVTAKKVRDLAEKIRRAKCFHSYYKKSEFPEDVLDVVCCSDIHPLLLRITLGDPSFLLSPSKCDNDFTRRREIIELSIDSSAEASLEILLDAVEKCDQWGAVSRSLEETLRSPGFKRRLSKDFDQAAFASAVAPDDSDDDPDASSAQRLQTRNLSDTVYLDEAMFQNHGRLHSMGYFHAMIEVGETVCAICYCKKNGKCGVATGFLVGKDVVVTCNHAIGTDQSVEKVSFAFNKKEVKNDIQLSQVYKGKEVLWRDTHLDVMLVRLSNQVALPQGTSYRKLERLPLCDTAAKFYDRSEKLNSELTIIQHPWGNLQMASKAGKLYRKSDAGKPWLLIHQISTAEGSSGSPIVDASGVLVGIHTGAKYQLLSPKRKQPLENEGVFVNNIVYNIPEALLKEINGQ